MGGRRAQLALFAGAVVAAQLAAAGAGKAFLLTPLTMTAWYTLAALGLCLLMGYAGQISLGHAGFFAVGGYTSAALTTLDLSAAVGRSAALARLEALHVLVRRADLYGGAPLGVHPWAALAAALLLTGLLALVVGIPVLRLKGHYLAMATLGVGLIVQSVVVGTPALGAADGLSGVPPLPLAPGLALAGGAPARVASYYVAWGAVGLALLLLGNLVESRVGRALRAIHGAEDAAAGSGVDTARLKLASFVLGAVLAAAAGAALAHYNGGLGPSEASPLKSVRYVAVVAMGGMGSLWGTVAASTVLNFLSLRGAFGSADDAVFGAALVLVMLFAPDGVLAARPVERLRAALRERVARRAAGGGAP